MLHRTSLNCLALLVVLTGLVVVPGSAFARSDGWSQHQCNVAAVTWARTHPHTAAYKVKGIAYLKQLNKQHGCTFRHLP